MRIVLTDELAMARSTASALGANEKVEGYLYGNGYVVTWTYSHLLVQISLSAYGPARVERQALPLTPVPFRLVVRQVRTEEEYITDPPTTQQLGVLRGLFENAEGVVIATDAGHEGELVGRYLLDHLGYCKPALRLWISSLTERATLNEFKSLRRDDDFDNLALAARVHREADWILGVSASIALGIIADMSNHSLGRVQTPTLALICRCYLGNKDFMPVNYHHL